MALDTLFLFALTEFVLCLTPGPAVLFVVALSMRRGVRAGWAASLGVTAGTVFYFGLSAIGVGALIVASHTLFAILKWAGAGYLAYLGARMIWPLLTRRGGDALVATPEAVPPMSSNLAAFWKGFAVQLANPKTLMFFMALFPQFIDPAGNVALQFTLMAIVSAAMELPILMVYAFGASAALAKMRPAVTRWIEVAGGTILIGMAGALVRSSAR